MNNEGAMSWHTDPVGRVTSYCYDAAGKSVHIEDHAPAPVREADYPEGVSSQSPGSRSAPWV